MHLFMLNFILWDLAYSDDCQDSFEPDLSFNIVCVIYDIFWCIIFIRNVCYMLMQIA